MAISKQFEKDSIVIKHIYSTYILDHWMKETKKLPSLTISFS
jgi:hypothetical protein